MKIFGIGIDVIEVERILRESDAGKEALATLEAASKVKGEELESRAQELQDLQKRYQDTLARFARGEDLGSMN